MDRRWLSLGSLALASCCCRPCAPCGVAGAPAAAPRVIDFAPSPMGVQPPDLPPPDTRWPERKPAALPPGFEDELKRIHGLTDEVAQRRALAALHAKSPGAFADVDPASLAAVAPAVLRVYGLSAALADGGDFPESVLPSPLGGDAAGAPPGPTGPAGRLARIEERLAWAAGLFSWTDDETFLDAVDRHIVVLAPPGMLADIESKLDQVATAGGPTVRLRVDVLHDADAFAKRFGVDLAGQTAFDLMMRPVRLAAVPTEADLAPLRTASFMLDAPHGRLVGARRSSSTSYVKDFDVEVEGDSRITDPIVGTVRDGIAVSAGLDAELLNQVRHGSLWCRAEVGELVRPMPTFQASQGAATVSVDLPELRVRRFEGFVEPAPGSAYLFAPSAGGVTALLRLECGPGPVVPAKPGWKRVRPGAAPPAEPRRIVSVEFAFWRDGNDAKPVTTSKVSVLEGQRATVQVMNRLSYIQGYETDRVKGIVDPIVGTVADGVSVDFSALPGEGAGRIFDVRISTSRVETPIRTFDVTTGSQKTTIQLPVSHDVVAPFRVVLKPGEERRLAPISVWTPDGPKEFAVSIRYVSEEAVR